MEKTLEIVLVGSGYYVCGGKKKDYGTILPAIISYAKLSKIFINIVVAIKNKNSIENFLKKFEFLKNKLSINHEVTCEFIECEGSPKKFLNHYKSKNNNVAGIISIPDHLHYEWSLALIKAYIPLLVVKPLTLRLSESVTLFELSQKLSVPIFVEFHKRFDKQVIFTRDAFQNGVIGIPLYSYTEYTQRKEVPLENFRDWAAMSNIFSYLGVHYVDVMRFVTEAIPKRVNASGQKIFLIEEGIDTFDSIQCNIEWETKQGTLFNQLIICSWIESNKSSAMSKQDFHIIGTKGRLDCEQKERGLKVLTDNLYSEDINPDFTKLFSFKDSFLFKGYGIDSINTFLEDINNKELSTVDKCKCDIKEALISTAVIEAAYKSIQNNSKWIEIDPIIK